MIEPGSSRRWYQFNLRTLFLAFTMLCLACGLDAYHGKWIRLRRDAFRREGIGGTSRNPHNLLAPKLAPRGMWLFGEPGYSAIFVRDDAITDERVEELRELFPEAKSDEVLTWSKYRKQVFDEMKRTQSADGSWSHDSWTARMVGPIYVTACYLTVLQLDKAALPNYQR